MKLFPLALIAALAPLGSIHAASGIINTFINVTSSNQNGGAATWYDASATTGLANFNGFDFGTFDPAAGGSLGLTGAEINTWKNNGSDVTATTLFYRIYSAGSPSGSFTGLNVGWTANAPFADAASNNYFNSGDQKWSNSSSWNPINLLTGLSSGNYVIDAYLTSTTNGWDTVGTHFANNGGSNFKANFSVVPEPSATLLGLLGAAALLRRRR